MFNNSPEIPTPEYLLPCWRFEVITQQKGVRCITAKLPCLFAAKYLTVHTKNLDHNQSESHCRGHENFTHIFDWVGCIIVVTGRLVWCPSVVLQWLLESCCGVSEHFKNAVFIHSKYCPGRKNITFTVPLNTITAARCSKAGTEILSDNFTAFNIEKCCGVNLTVHVHLIMANPTFSNILLSFGYACLIFRSYQNPKWGRTDVNRCIL